MLSEHFPNSSEKELLLKNSENRLAFSETANLSNEISTGFASTTNEGRKVC